MMGRIARVLSPVGWMATAVVVVGLMFIIGQGLGLKWDPFQRQARRLEAAEQRLGRAESEATARHLEAEARGLQVQSLDIFHRNAMALTAATVAAEAQARTADDANTPLATDRVQRLRDHDRELCSIAPTVGGCPAAADPS